MRTKGSPLLLGIVLVVGFQTSSFAQDYGPAAGEWEITLTGNGFVAHDLDDHSGFVSGSLGYYVTRALEVSLQQSVSFVDSGDSARSGMTLAGLDYHFDLGRLRPFVGGSLGAVYSDWFRDSFQAGGGGGIKFYALEKTFIYARGEYAWRAETPNYDDTAFLYSLGIGFNF
jgi:hypothetical protein